MASTLDRTAELMTDADITEVSMPIKKILVPTDGSATAVEATKVAISMAKVFGAEIVALYVNFGSVETPIEYIDTEAMEGIKHSSAGLDVAARLGEKNGVKVSCVTSEGAVGNRIVAVSKESEVDLIVMGSVGRTGFKRLALGSVAESVMKESDAPVLVVRNCTTEFCMTPRG